MHQRLTEEQRELVLANLDLARRVACRFAMPSQIPAALAHQLREERIEICLVVLCEVAAESDDITKFREFAGARMTWKLCEHQRQAARRRTVQLDDIDDLAMPQDRCDEWRVWLEEGLERLTGEQRRIVELRRRGVNVAEIADRLGMSRDTLWHRWTDAVRLLRA